MNGVPTFAKRYEARRLSTTGDLGEPVPFGGETYSDSVLVDAISYRDGAAVHWIAYLDPPCLSSRCTRRSQHHVTTFDAAGNVINDLADSSFSAIAVSGQTLMVASTTGASRIIEPDGTTRDVSFATSPPATVKLTAIPGGFELLQLSTYPQKSGEIVRFDLQGNVTMRAAFNPLDTLRDSLSAFGKAWYLGDVFWTPLPQAHDGRVWRSYLATFTPRRRAS